MGNHFVLGKIPPITLHYSQQEYIFNLRLLFVLCNRPSRVVLIPEGFDELKYPRL